MMPAPTGNAFWKARSSRGRSPAFATPEELWAAACEYFEWVDANPLTEAKPFAYQGEVRIEHVARMRAMTVGGLCLFLDIGRSTFAAYRARQRFAEVAQKIDDVIRTQKFEGAAADLFNAAIVQRELALTDKTDPPAAPEAVAALPDEVLDARIARLIAETRTAPAARGKGKAARKK
jgi:hypothetical protein